MDRKYPVFYRGKSDSSTHNTCHEDLVIPLYQITKNHLWSQGPNPTINCKFIHEVTVM